MQPLLFLPHRMSQHAVGMHQPYVGSVYGVHPQSLRADAVGEKRGQFRRLALKLEFFEDFFVYCSDDHHETVSELLFAVMPTVGNVKPHEVLHYRLAAMEEDQRIDNTYQLHHFKEMEKLRVLKREGIVAPAALPQDVFASRELPLRPRFLFSPSVDPIRAQPAFLSASPGNDLWRTPATCTQNGLTWQPELSKAPSTTYEAVDIEKTTAETTSPDTTNALVALASRAASTQAAAAQRLLSWCQSCRNTNI